METREELIEKQQELYKQINTIQEKIQEIDYSQKFEEANKFVGKYYLENHKMNQPDYTYYRCFYVYDINKETCQLHALEISYNSESLHWFSIQYYSCFYPEREDFDIIEIPKQEFETHYSEIQRRINIMTK